MPLVTFVGFQDCSGELGQKERIIGVTISTLCERLGIKISL